MAENVSYAQRALWTFLMVTLVGPFFGALLVTALLILPPTAALAPAGLPPGQLIVAAYVWCALPAGFAGLGLAALVLRSGRLGMIEAAAAGVVAFVVAIQVFPFDHRGQLPALAFAAGCVAVVLRAVLLRARILTAD